MTGQKFYKDFMVDVETTGLEPNRHALLQISAVPFDFHTREISGVFFDRCLQIPNWRHCNEQTMTWWHTQNLEVFKDIVSRGEAPGGVMDLFAQFVKDISGNCGNRETRFWYKRPFDWQFVEGYFRDFSVVSPFHYHNAIEMTAYLKGAGRDISVVNLPIKSDGPAHNAYWDACLQIKKLFATLDHYKEVQK